MSRPITPPNLLCTMPHRIPCLAHKDVLNGPLEPCQNCAPHADKVRALFSVTDAMKAGFGGMTKEGRLVDRRKDPSASTIAANSFLGIATPQHLSA